METLLRLFDANPAAVTGGIVALAVCAAVLANMVLDARDARRIAALQRQLEALKLRRDRLKRDHDA